MATETVVAVGEAPAVAVGKFIIPRCWETGEEYPVFSVQTELPASLTSRLPAEVFGATIGRINEMLAEASRTSFKAIMKAVGAFLFSTDLITASDYDKALENLTAFLDNENKKTFEPAGLHIVDPRRTAFLHIEILIMDDDQGRR
ncbi:hypothetical protein HDU67_007305 [Dinochytrium kinnereticum]|nr:hypothetical protein HDU67_007305 [Dinochytrium kinnereticum]